jgi:DNA-directed RNA polymerase specialized sigma24 family protein
MAAPKLNARKVTEMRRIFADPDNALGYADLASMFRVSEATVRYHLIDLAPANRPGPRLVCFNRVSEMLEQGSKTKDIAAAFGVKQRSVQRAIREIRLRAAA